jgi:hypothetical protein
MMAGPPESKEDLIEILKDVDPWLRNKLIYEIAKHYTVP